MTGWFRGRAAGTRRLGLVIVVALAGLTVGPPASAGRVQATPAAAATPEARPTPLPAPIAWIELGPDGAVIARAVTIEAACPAITEDGAARSMEPRGAADAANFPVTVCEATIPAGTTAAAVAGQPLPLPAGTPRRIAVVGDTGCRMESPDDFQACNDPRRWPFAAIAAQVAAWQPDLIVHVGDYHYRESACPVGNTGCAGSPTGDTWASWQADFFGPAAPLLGAAPWVFVRGNHETCGRAGEGWFRLLDPRPLPAACQPVTEPYAVPVGDLQLLVLDSAGAADATAPADRTAAYAAQFATLRRLAGPAAWLLSHRPIWGIDEIAGTPTTAEIEPDNGELEAAVGAGLPPGVQLILSGHLHRFEVVGFAPGTGRAPQLVSGNGGTALDPVVTTSPVGLDLAGTPVAEGAIVGEFGYLALEPTATGWTTTALSASGEVLVACAVADLKVDCPG